MQTPNAEASAFVGNVPENYDKYMVIFSRLVSLHFVILYL